MGIKRNGDIPAVEWLNALLSLALAKLGWIRELKEGWCKLHEPPGIDSNDLAHVFLSGLHQLMVNNPTAMRK